MHYKASGRVEQQPLSTRGRISHEVSSAYYARARSADVVTIIRANLQGKNRLRTPGIELRCKGHSTGCAVYFGLVVNTDGRGREDAVAFPRYHALVHPTAADTFDDVPAIVVGSPPQSVTIRCMVCGRTQTRKGLWGLNAAAEALEAGRRSCDWMT